MPIFRISALFAFFAATALAQIKPAPPAAVPTEFDKLSDHFSYDHQAPIDFRQTGVQMRGKVMIVEMNYAGAENDRVPAYLVIPPGDGPFAAILWGHWMMPGSPMMNKDEFLDEAVVLARSGVVSLLIDTPMVRPEYQQKSPQADPMGWAEQFSETERQYVIDLRRGLDLLLARPHVDAKRVAYVGHSYSAHTGALLAGVEHRIGNFVLMAGSYSDEETVRNAKDGDVFRWKQTVGPEKLQEYLHDYAWDDPIHYLGHTDGENIFLQFAARDPVTPQQAQKWLEMFSAKDKKLEFYQAPHALNSAARLDRDRWLQEHLRFKKLNEGDLEKIPQLK